MIFPYAKTKEVEDRELRCAHAALVEIGSCGNHPLLQGVKNILGEKSAVGIHLGEGDHTRWNSSARQAIKYLAGGVGSILSVIGAHGGNVGGAKGGHNNCGAWSRLERTDVTPL